MPLDEGQRDELKAMMAAARKGDVNFGLCLGQKPEETAMVAHRKRGADALGREAKKLSGTTHVGYGKMRCEGKMLVLNFESKVPPGTAKKTKLFLKTIGLKLGVSVFDPTGVLADSDSDDDDELPQGEGNTAEKAEGQADWEKLAAELGPKVEWAATSGRGDPGKLRAAWGLAVEKSVDGDFVTANAIGARVRTMFAATTVAQEGAPTGTVAAARWEAESEAVLSRLKEVLSGGTGDPGKMRAVWDFAAGKAENGEHEAALKSVATLRKLMDEAAGTARTAETESKPENPGAAKLALEMQSLESQVVAALAGAGGDSSRLRVLWGFVTEKATAGETDAALKALPKLREALALAQQGAAVGGDAAAGKAAHARAKALGDRLTKLAPTLAEAQRLFPARASDIKARVAAVENGISTADFDTVEAGIGELDKLGSDVTTRKKELEVAMTGVTMRKATIATLRTLAESRFLPELPPTLAADLAICERALEVANEIDPAKVTAAVDATDTPADRASNTIDRLTAELAKWSTAYGATSDRETLLGKHPGANQAAVGKMLLQVRKGIEDAELKAEVHDYADGIQRLDSVMTLIESAEKAADAASSYTVLEGERTTRVTALPDSPADPRLMVRIGALWDGLQKAADLTKKTPPDFAGAVAILRPMAVECQDIEWLDKQAAEVKTLRDQFSDMVDLLEDPPPAAFAVQVAAMKQALKDIDTAVRTDKAKALDLINRATGTIMGIDKAMEQHKKFRDDRAAAEKLLKEVEDHAGAKAVEPDIKRLRGDLAFADSKASAGAISTGMAAIQKVAAEAPELKKVAEKKVAYDAALKPVTDARAALDPVALVALPDMVAEFAREMTEIEKRVAERDFDTAIAAIGPMSLLVKMMGEQCKLEVKLKAAESIKETGGDVAVGNDPGAFEASYQDLRALVLSLDASGTYNDRLQDADAKAYTGLSLARKSPPDAQAANSDMDEALAGLRSVAETATSRGRYDRLHSLMEALKKAKVDKNTKTALDTVRKRIDDAFAAAATGAQQEDWDAAMAQLLAARTSMNEFDRLAKILGQYELLRDGAIATQRTAMATPEAVKELKEEGEQFVKDADAAEKLTSDGMIEAGFAALKALEKRGAAFVHLLAAAEAARERESSLVTAHLAKAKDRPEVVEQWREIETMLTGLEEMFKRRVFAAAEKQCFAINVKLTKADLIATARTEFATLRAAAATAIDDLRKVALPEAGPTVSDALRAAEKLLAEADAEDNDNVPENAVKLVKKIPDTCKDATALGTRAATAVAAVTKAETEVAALEKDLGGQPLVTSGLTGLRDRLKRARALIAGGSMEEALKAAIDSAAEGRRLRESGQRVAAADKASADLKESPPVGEAEVAAALAAARNEIGTLGAVPGLKKMADAASAMLDKADIALAKGSVPDALKELSQARTLIAKGMAAIETRLAMHRPVLAARQRAEALRNAKDGAAAEARLDAADKLLAVAASLSAQGNNSAFGYLDSVQAELDMAEAFGRQDKEYRAALSILQAAADTLAGATRRDAGATELAAVQTAIIAAGTSANDGDYKKALATLATASKACAKGQLSADMQAGEAISSDRIARLLAEPGGETTLDEVMADLDPATRARACEAALEARFGIKMTQYSDTEGTKEDTRDPEKAATILRLYEVMKKLPTKHTTNNPSLDKVKRLGDENGNSSYAAPDRTVKLRVGRATDRRDEVLGEEWQLGPIDKTKVFKDGPPAQSFTWTTLHEIGHALDDKLGFMAKNGDKGEYGGWKQYSSDLSEIAAAAAGKFKYDKDYIERYLADPTGGFVAPDSDKTEKDLDPEVWERRRLEAVDWCDAIRANREIWFSASETSRLEIGGKVYQEAYNGKWVSYLFSARSTGVKGYQFRAPGEWFAELYAAHHTDKLSSSHPAKSWLAQL